MSDTPKLTMEMIDLAESNGLLMIRDEGAEIRSKLLQSLCHYARVGLSGSRSYENICTPTYKYPSRWMEALGASGFLYAHEAERFLDTLNECGALKLEKP